MAAQIKGGLSSVEASVLSAIVELGLKKGGPVGSEALSRRKGIALCAASIRAVMAKLTREGYLSQPHSSAGREPTDKGYSFYALRLAPAARLPHAISSQIIEAAEDPALPETTSRLDAISRTVSRLSHQVALAGLVSTGAVPIREYVFMRLGAGRIGVALVTMNGELLRHSFNPGWEPTTRKLERMTAYFNEKLSFMTVSQARRLCGRELTSSAGERAELARDAHALAQALDEGMTAADSEMVIVEGAENLVNLVEDGGDLDAVKALGDALGEKKTMMPLLSALAKGGAESVMIGAEMLIGGLAACSVVAHPFAGPHGVEGAIGVIGKKRMDYGYARALVSLAARRMTKSLGGQERRG
jgi:heat-inducible transcriptional repressor